MKRLVKILGLALLAWVAWTFVDFREFFGTVGSLSLVATLVLLAVATSDRFLMIFKWQQLCRAVGIRVPFREVLAAYYGASFLCYFLPTTLGGDIYRGYRVARSSSDRPGVIASLVVEKVIGAFATIVYAWVGLFYLILNGIALEARPVFVALLAASGVAILLFLGSLHPGLHRVILRPFGESSPLARRFGKLSVAYRAFAEHPAGLVANLALAVVESGVQILLVLGTAWALGIDVAPLTFFAVTTIAEFLRRSSMVLDGWGLAESLRILIYGLVGITAADALAVGLVSHAVMALASVPGAIVFFADPNRHEIRRRALDGTGGIPGSPNGTGTRDADRDSASRAAEAFSASEAPAPGPDGPPPSGGVAAKSLRLFKRVFTPKSLVTLHYFLKSRTKISPRAEVELSPNLKFGRGCTVSSFVKIKSTAGPLLIGEKSGFATGCFISSGAAGIEIGKHVLCGPNVSIVGSSYIHDELDVPFEEQGSTSKGVRIGDNVWIGANSVVADGASIGENTIVVAGSLVTRRYPPNVIIQGAPARIILKRARTQGGEPTCERESSTSSRVPSTT